MLIGEGRTLFSAAVIKPPVSNENSTPGNRPANLPRKRLAYSCAERVRPSANCKLTNASIGPELGVRSEEHTSELQSHLNLVCRLLLEKKKELRKRAKDRNARANSMYRRHR